MFPFVVLLIWMKTCNMHTGVRAQASRADPTVPIDRESHFATLFRWINILDGCLRRLPWKWLISVLLVPIIYLITLYEVNCIALKCKLHEKFRCFLCAHQMLYLTCQHVKPYFTYSYSVVYLNLLITSTLKKHSNNRWQIQFWIRYWRRSGDV